MKNITKALKAKVRVESMQSRNGNDVPNQFIIYADYGVMFRSYGSNIAFKPYDENILYLGEDWDYSKTTGKYRNEFLGYGVAELRARIADGRAIVKKDL